MSTLTMLASSCGAFCPRLHVWPVLMLYAAAVALPHVRPVLRLQRLRRGHRPQPSWSPPQKSESLASWSS